MKPTRKPKLTVQNGPRTFDAAAMWTILSGSGGQALDRAHARIELWQIPQLPGEWRIFYFNGLVSVSNGVTKQHPGLFTVVFYRAGEVYPTATMTHAPDVDGTDAFAATLGLYHKDEAVTVCSRDEVTFCARADAPAGTIDALHALCDWR